MILERRCSKCKELKNLHDNFYKCRGGYLTICKKCHAKTPSKLSPKAKLWGSSRANAARSGLVHTISQSDIELPEFCKYLGIRIDYQSGSGMVRRFDGPSIDRVDPKKGYIPGNIQVISDLANRMKADATVEQLLSFARGVLSVHSSN